MEIDKKALAVTRLVSVIYNWDPNLRSNIQNQMERAKVISRLLKEALPNLDSQKRAINMVLAMTLLTSGKVAIVRDPSSFDEKKTTAWSRIISDPTSVFLEALGFPTYSKITKQDYINAKKLLPVIGSSSMLKSEVQAVFQSTSVSKDYPKISSVTIDKDKYGELGLGGYEFLYRGLSNMTENAIIRVTDIGNTWDSSSGVSTSYDYRSAQGFATSGNNILFSLRNPKRRGFNALKLSRYAGEKEIILSGVSKINDFQLTFSAESVGEDGQTISLMDLKFLRVEVSSDMIFIREGSQPIYMKRYLSADVVHDFVKRALTFETIELESPQTKQKIKFIADKDSSSIQVTGEIL